MQSILNWFPTPSESSATIGWGIFLARVLTGGLLFYYHGLHKALEGYRWFRGTAIDWPLVKEIAESGFPKPAPMAVIVTSIQLIGGLCLCFGCYTRVAVVIVMGVMFGAVKTNLTLRKSNQLAILYLTLLAIVLLLGSGTRSLDAGRANQAVPSSNH